MPSVTEKISILLQWTPVLNYLIAISSAKPGRDRVYRAFDLLDFLASKTPTPADNELLDRLRAVLLTPAGAELLDYLADILDKALNRAALDSAPTPKA